MIRTLHHMADPVLALSEVRRVMAQMGIFILEFANKRNLKAILRYWLKKQAWSPFSLEPVEFAELNFDFHPQAIKQYLKENNFAIERQLSLSHFRLGFLKKYIPTSILVGLDSALQWTGKFAQLSPSLFTRARAVGDLGAPCTEDDMIFKCVNCGAPLSGMGQDLTCSTCGAVWEFRDGIYDFREKAN
jgi:hypothetical protein